jgi:hypothetical protein
MFRKDTNHDKEICNSLLSFQLPYPLPYQILFTLCPQIIFIPALAGSRKRISIILKPCRETPLRQKAANENND